MEINEQFNKATQYTQKELINREKLPTTMERNLPFVVPFDNKTVQIGKILKSNWHLITDDINLKRIWNKEPFIALKKHNNIKDTIVRAKIKNTKIK